MVFNDKGGHQPCVSYFKCFYEFYDDINALKTRLQSENIIQCIVSDGIIENSIGFEKHKT
jgi:hypothetical protein